MRKLVLIVIGMIQCLIISASKSGIPEIEMVVVEGGPKQIIFLKNIHLATIRASERSAAQSLSACECPKRNRNTRALPKLMIRNPRPIRPIGGLPARAKPNAIRVEPKL